MSELDKAMALEAQIMKGLGVGRERDVLGDYRMWLDKNEIPAEVDGWPSPEAYDSKNITAFIEQEAPHDNP